MPSTLTPGDEWTGYYRGYRLQTNPDGDVWWQPYQGTERLYLQPTPDELIDALLDLKRLGGRVRVTEDNDVITQVEDGDRYETLWVGDLSPNGELVPMEDPAYSIPVQPSDVDSGEFWPSVYDGAKYSFSTGAERVWWANPDTHQRHPVQTSLSTDVVGTLTRLKPRGGSFRVTPWNDVLTLVDLDKLPANAQEEFDALPRVVRNLIALRKDRGGVDKLPVYVGEIDTTPLEIGDPRSLTDPVTSSGVGIDEWTESLGPTSTTDVEDHSVEDAPTESEDEFDLPADDPSDW